MTSTPYGQFVGVPVYGERGGIERYQLVHVDCPRKGEAAVLGESVGFLPLSQLIEAADKHWIELHSPMLPRIPDGKWRFRREPPRFVRMPEFSHHWLLLGREIDLVPGTDVEVSRYGDGETSAVRVSQILAARIVHHRANSYGGSGTTRFVLAEFESLTED